MNAVELDTYELDELRRSFKSFIQPHLVSQDSEDYELVWQWEKFIFDKSQRIQNVQSDKGISPLLRSGTH